MAKKCIKCGYERQQNDQAPEYECPQCGVIYAKAEALATIRDSLGHGDEQQCASLVGTKTRSRARTMVIAGVAVTLVAAAALYVATGSRSTDDQKMPEQTRVEVTARNEALSRKNEHATAALNTARSLMFRTEAGIDYRTYATAVSDLAVQIKTYLAADASASNGELAESLTKLMEVHITTRDVWHHKIESGDALLFSTTNESDWENSFWSSKMMRIYPPILEIAREQARVKSQVHITFDHVIQLLWLDARKQFEQAVEANGGKS